MYATLTIEAIDFEQELIFTPEERYAQLTLYVQQLQLSVESNLSTVVAEFFLGNYLKGVGISSIVKTSSVGLVDTYTITFTDNTTTTFDVTNGEDGSDGIGISNIELISTIDKVKTYRITFTDSSTFEYTITDGADGRGIVSFDLINTVGKTKTYRLLYTDSTSVDINIVDGNDGNDGATPYIGLNGNWWINGVDQNVKAEGVDGRGIVSIIKTSTVGLVDTYTITYSDATTSTFDVTNGTNGEMNVIDEVQVNGTTLPVTNKSVNVIVPTQPSDIGAEPANSNIQEHISDETIHHTIEELNLLYSDINHNHNLNDLTEKSYNSLTDKPDLSSLHTHANKEDLDNYDPDNFEPANSNIQEHISNTNIHIDSSSELGEAINESTHSLLLWNGLKALKVTFARMKTWIGSDFLKLDQSTPQTLTHSPIINTLTAGQMCYVDSNKKLVAIPVYWDAVKTQMQIGNAAIFSNYNGLSIEKSIVTKGNVFVNSGDGQFGNGVLYYALNATFRIQNIDTGQNSALSFWTKNIEAVRIDPSQNVCVGGTDPKAKMDVRGGVRVGDDTAAASSNKVGTIRYRATANASYVEMCVQIGATSYQWQTIITNTW